VTHICDGFYGGFYDYCFGGGGGGGDVKNEKNEKKIVCDFDTDSEEQLLMSLQKQMDQIMERYETENKPLGDATVYIPPRLLQEISDIESSSKAKKGGKNSKKKGGNKKKKQPSLRTHASVISQLTCTFFHTILTTIQRPSLVYSRAIQYACKMFFDAMGKDLDIAISICGGNDTATGGNTGKSILALKQKSLEYATSMKDLVLPLVFSDEWYNCFSALGDLLVLSLLRILTSQKFHTPTPKMTQDTAKALDFYTKFVYPEMVSNVLSESTREISAGWKTFNTAITIIPINMVVDLVSDHKMWNSIYKFCNKDLEEYLHGLGFTSTDNHPDRTRELKYYIEALCEAFSFLSLFFTRLDTIKDKTSSRYTKVFERIKCRDIIELCMTSVKKKPEMEHATFIDAVMRCLCSMAQHGRYRDALWEYQSDIVYLLRKTIKAKNGDSVFKAMNLVTKLMQKDDGKWHGFMMKIDPPIDNSLMIWTAYGMNAFCRRVYDAQSEYMNAIEKQVKKFEIYCVIQKKECKTIKEEKFLCDFNAKHDNMKFPYHWNDVKREAEYSLRDANDALKNSIVVFANLFGRKGFGSSTSLQPTLPSAAIRKMPNILLSVFVALIDSWQTKLIEPIVYLLRSYFSVEVYDPRNYPLSSTLKDPDFFIDRLQSYGQFMLGEINLETAINPPIVGGIAKDILDAMGLSDAWPTVPFKGNNRFVDKSNLDDQITFCVRNESPTVKALYFKVLKKSRFMKVADEYAKRLGFSGSTEFAFWHGEHRIKPSKAVWMLGLEDDCVIFARSSTLTARCIDHELSERITICVKNESPSIEPIFFKIMKKSRFVKVTDEYAKRLGVVGVTVGAGDFEFYDKEQNKLSPSETVKMLNLKDHCVILAKSPS